MNRRSFLAKGLATASTAAVGLSLQRAVNALAQVHVHGTGNEPSNPPLPPVGPQAQAVRAQPVTLPHTMPPAPDPSGRQGVPGRKWIMVIDLAKCDGCGKCTQACGKMHFIPPDRQWIPVLVMRDSDNAAPYYFPRPCFHCDVPPCTKVCPVDATYKTQDGTVLIDNNRCIGCRFCIAACPYGVRVFNWGKPANPPQAQSRGYNPAWGYPRQMGTVEKCDFCPDHAAAGELPACSSGCPMGAVYFGDQNEDAVTNSAGETLRFSKLIRDRAGYRHLEELGTHPRVYYLPPVNRQYPPPELTSKEVGL
jgi:molybdopterin-containing oxidoreductase family iron-sulfur binding subunit